MGSGQMRPEDDTASRDKANDHSLRCRLEKALEEKRWNKKMRLYAPLISTIGDHRIASSPAVSVIIISHCLRAETADILTVLSGGDRSETEIIYVNNGGKNLDFLALAKQADIYISLNRNDGAYLARNVGAIFAYSPLLLFLDDDAILSPDLVSHHIAAFDTYDVIAVRGVVKPRTDNPLNELASHYNLGEQPFPGYMGIEGNTTFAASCFFAIGGWDDSITFGGGGLDISRRLFDVVPDHRRQMYSPCPVIYHDYARNEEHLIAKRTLQEKSRARLRRKHRDYDTFLNSWKPFFQREDLLIRRCDRFCKKK